MALLRMDGECVSVVRAYESASYNLKTIINWPSELDFCCNRKITVCCVCVSDVLWRGCIVYQLYKQNVWVQIPKLQTIKKIYQTLGKSKRIFRITPSRCAAIADTGAGDGDDDGGLHTA